MRIYIEYFRFMDPITVSDYPSTMRRNVGNQLPTFFDGEQKMVKGSIEFLGLNYYTITYVIDTKIVDPPSYSTDIGVGKTSKLKSL